MNKDTSQAPDYRNSGIQDLGIVNNNIGNMIDDGEPWHGKVGTNGRFLVFINLWYGIRALGINLTSLIKKYKTVAAYINAYAPPSDGNDTNAYIAKICNDTGLRPNDPIQLNNALLAKLIRSHAEQENSKAITDQYVSDADIQAGIALITDALGNPVYPQ